MRGFDLLAVINDFGELLVAAACTVQTDAKFWSLKLRGINSVLDRQSVAIGSLKIPNANTGIDFEMTCIIYLFFVKV